MSFYRFRTMAAAVLALSAAQASQADVGAQDVWSNWQSYLDTVGYEISATQAQSGNTLTLSEVTITIPDGQDDTNSTLTLEEVVFTENDDGTVSIAFPETMPVLIPFVAEEGESGQILVEIRQSGLASTVSGTPTDMTNTYAAQGLDVVLTELIVDGKTQNTDLARATIGVADVAGTIKSMLGDTRVVDQDMRASGLTYDFAFADAEGEADVKLNGQMADLSLNGSSELPLTKVTSGDVASLLAAGLNGAGTFKYSAGASNVSMIENGTNVLTSATTSSGGSLTTTIGPDGLDYAGNQNDLKATMSSRDFPVPLDVAMEVFNFNLASPIQKSETAAPFALGFTFDGFSMSEAMWGLFDPSAQLPRTPATIALDLTGTARVLLDLLDPAELVTDAVPAELETMDINKLQITAAGAELTGDGAFRFEYGEPSGTPRPIGVADLSLAGGNKLLDTLVAMGLLPEEQAMGARMMMGLLAVPGPAPDTLKSRIEMNEQGHVMANGQRIQ